MILLRFKEEKKIQFQKMTKTIERTKGSSAYFNLW